MPSARAEGRQHEDWPRIFARDIFADSSPRDAFTFMSAAAIHGEKTLLPKKWQNGRPSRDANNATIVYS